MSERTVERHPIADLLTDEQRAKMLAPVYYRTKRGQIRTRRIPGQRPLCCPFGVLVGRRVPTFERIFGALGLDGFAETSPRKEIVRSFTRLMDNAIGPNATQPEDLPILLAAS